MEPIFKKCLAAMTQINEQTIPMMSQSYNQLMKNMQNTIQSNQNLNQSRQYAKAAIEASNSGLIDNRNVLKYLEYLKATDEKLNNRSRYLTDLLEDIKNRFLKISKKISNKNLQYLNEMKNGNTSAQELLVQIVKLGKESTNVINEIIPSYEREIVNYIKKTENEIVDDAFKYYNEIIKLDSGTFPAIKVRQWTYLEDRLFRTSGAFVNRDYHV